jgi:ABC-type amino acid transport system permease subunit
MNDLIKNIKETSPLTRLEIIKMLDDNTSFQKEKKEFVEVWME